MQIWTVMCDWSGNFEFTKGWRKLPEREKYKFCRDCTMSSCETDELNCAIHKNRPNPRCLLFSKQKRATYAREPTPKHETAVNWSRKIPEIAHGDKCCQKYCTAYRLETDNCIKKRFGSSVLQFYTVNVLNISKQQCSLSRDMTWHVTPLNSTRQQVGTWHCFHGLMIRAVGLWPSIYHSRVDIWIFKVKL